MKIFYVLLLIGLIGLETVIGQGIFGMRCPNGRPGGQRCNGWNPNCPPGYYCYAPADAGVCCRQVIDVCPPQLPGPCDGYRPNRRCRSDRQCRRGQRCCPDRCGGRTCQ